MYKFLKLFFIVSCFSLITNAASAQSETQLENTQSLELKAIVEFINNPPSLEFYPTTCAMYKKASPYWLEHLVFSFHLLNPKDKVYFSNLLNTWRKSPTSDHQKITTEAIRRSWHSLVNLVVSLNDKFAFGYFKDIKQILEMNLYFIDVNYISSNLSDLFEYSVIIKNNTPELFYILITNPNLKIANLSRDRYNVMIDRAIRNGVITEEDIQKYPALKKYINDPLKNYKPGVEDWNCSSRHPGGSGSDNYDPSTDPYAPIDFTPLPVEPSLGN